MAVEYDIVVIGGGSGGLVVASAAAQLKAKVALVEKDRLGGECLWSGCVPSKALIHASRTAYEVKNASRFGIYAHSTDIHFAEVMAHVNRAIAAIQPHDSPERFQELGVEVIFGSGEFIDAQTFRVNNRDLTARAFVIATGSHPAIPPIPGLTETDYLTNENLFTLRDRVQSLAIIGSGPIGCEIGQAFHRLGSAVTIFSSGPQILAKEDPDAAAVIEEQFLSEGIEILKNARVEKVEVAEGKKRLWFGSEWVEADQILVATGRSPNVERLNLAAAGVSFNEKGIKVNAKLQTTNPKIYACGDVIGGYQFTHVAGQEAVTVLKNALFFPTSKVNYQVIPWATFTDPELARVGMTEKQARSRYGDDIYVLKQPFSGSDRAQAEGSTQGFAKLIVRPNGEILGAHLVGRSAGELIAEIVLAMSHRLKVSALTGIHIYPTLTEVNGQAALLFQKQKFAENPWQKALLAKFFHWRRSWKR
ncbi:MAG: FAD-dependent oxidoreductase [Snowella sp.]|nr:FAD-dependent oxidoreductase [Snowella sp.]